MKSSDEFELSVSSSSSPRDSKSSQNSATASAARTSDDFQQRLNEYRQIVSGDKAGRIRTEEYGRSRNLFRLAHAAQVGFFQHFPFPIRIGIESFGRHIGKDEQVLTGSRETDEELDQLLNEQGWSLIVRSA